MEQGYEDSRFEVPVDRNFHCPICFNVLKEPMQCQSNEHYFCSPCIRKHLEQNSPSCPMCMDELTIEMLRRAPRIVVDYLCCLKIRCDHAARGCCEVIELEVLESHVARCDFSPVPCANDGCVEVVNKQDVEHHETKACVFKKMKCDDCGEEMVRRKYEAHGCLLRREMTEMKKSLTEMKKSLTEGMKCMQEKMMKELREEMKSISTEVNNVKQSVHYLCRINSINYIVVIGGFDKKYMALRSVERFKRCDSKWEYLPDTKKYHSGAAVVMFDNQILVSGGGKDSKNMTDSVEILNMNEELPKQWLDFPAKLPFKCVGHKCVVYENRLFVIGGCIHNDGDDNGDDVGDDGGDDGGDNGGDNSGDNSGDNADDNGYDNGDDSDDDDSDNGDDSDDDDNGYDNGDDGCDNADDNGDGDNGDGDSDDGYDDGHQASDGIYEVLLTPPYSSKLLCHMGQKRCFHGVELFDDKILIAGGETSFFGDGTLSSVEIFDISTNQCKEMAPLPSGVKGMATVRWEDDMILIGGMDGDDNKTNAVIAYDFKTGKSKALPSMKSKRAGATAVVFENTIVVMGGYRDKATYDLVESFNFLSNSWKEQPSMIKRRCFATACSVTFPLFNG